MMLKSIDFSVAGEFFSKYETKPLICPDFMLPNPFRGWGQMLPVPPGYMALMTTKLFNLRFV